MITLFENKVDCCGCGACVSVCPRGAISFKNDEYGFAYPEINNSLCIECGMCKGVCAFQNKEKENMPIKTYAAAKIDDSIMASTSGGLFSVLAEEVISKGGIVFGAVIEKADDGFTVHHKSVDNTEDLQALLKSKYVHSATEDCYIEAEKQLKSGRTVLYSGTPCQIAGLKGYLKKDYDNLTTVDIVCHGVPSVELFNKYIKCIEEKDNIKITDFLFRDKSKGWDLFNRIEYTDESGEKASLSFNSSHINYSYMDLFLQLSTLRDNCYECKYACANRPADISLGDYWGIKKVHGEWLKDNGGRLDSDKGISCVLLNSDKGVELFEQIKDKIIHYDSGFEDIAQGNTQLRHPADKPDNRAEILSLVKNNGYIAIEQRYQSYLNRENAKAKIKKLVPKKLWDKAKEIIKG